MNRKESEMAFRLEGKIAVITGAGQGIGRATAVLFQEAGARVWATDINQAALAQLSADHPAIQTMTLDVCDGAAIKSAAESLVAIDVLFNCAGHVHQGNILDCADEDWELSFRVNVQSMYRMCRAFIPGMLRLGRGNIINMSSIASSIKGVPNRCAYAATKAAVIGLTKSIAIDFVGKNIRCNAICPGTVDTPSLGERMASQGDLEKARAAFVARQPMGRLGTANEIAAAALYLASDEAAFVTGQTLVIDGGWCI